MKIKRLCFNKLWSEISVPEISILLGARQVGKSTLMRQIQAKAKRGEEVDFIVLKNRIPLPIEVKSHLSQPSIPKGMKLFLKKYPQAPYGIVFNASLQCQMECEERTVYFKRWTESSNLEYMQSVV